MGGRGASSFERGNYRQMLDLRKIDGADYETYRGGIEQITIYGRDNDYDRNREIERLMHGQYKSRYDVTQEELNKSPIAIWTMRTHDYYVFNSKADMDKTIKNVYGGYNQLGKLHKDYLITTASGKGEFYLERDRYAKGGFVWKDTDGLEVSGRQRRKTQSFETYKKRIERKSRR